MMKACHILSLHSVSSACGLSVKQMVSVSRASRHAFTSSRSSGESCKKHHNAYDGTSCFHQSAESIERFTGNTEHFS